MKHLKLFEEFYGQEEIENVDDICPTCKCHCDNCECVTDEDGECEKCNCTNCECDPEESVRPIGRRFGSPSPDFASRYSDDDESLEEKKKAKGKKEKWVPIWVKNKEKEDAKSGKKDDKKDDKKGDKKEDLKGLTAAQKKLPAGLRAAIARKAAKKSPKD